MRNDLALKIIMDCRTVESCNLKRILGFTLINTKEQIVINSIKDTFEGEDMKTKYTVLGYKIDLYFHKHKLTIEVDELIHNYRNIDYDLQRQKALETELDCVFIRIILMQQILTFFKKINKVHRHIKKSST